MTRIKAQVYVSVIIDYRSPVLLFFWKGFMEKMSPELNFIGQESLAAVC